LLSLGHFRVAAYYEHRWLANRSNRCARTTASRTDGPVAEGRTIRSLEQGLGDMFQFARYLPLLKARGARVLFQPLKGLTRSPGDPGTTNFADGERPRRSTSREPDEPALAFGTTVATIPAGAPYLSPDPAYLANGIAIRGPVATARRWAGRPTHRSDRLRSMHIDQLASILDVEGVRFVSLQKGPAAAQAEAVPERVDWDGIGAELDDLDDAAAVLSGLDLLIAVDTGLRTRGRHGQARVVMLQTPSEYR
jgi:hypothetical protein